MIKILAIGSVCFVAGLLVQEGPALLEYEFEPPAFTTQDQGTAFMHFMPQSDGFAPNVNLTVQAHEGTLEEYDKISQLGFEQAGFTLIRSEVRDDLLLYEYTGRLQGTSFHWYAKAYPRDGMIYLVTATSLEKNWEAQSEALIASVDSFALKR